MKTELCIRVIKTFCVKFMLTSVLTDVEAADLEET
jgi:uncharacterized protein YqgV (UPF0045/DUF77 family)